MLVSMNEETLSTKENWLALYACIINKELTANQSLMIMGLSDKADKTPISIAI